MPPAPNPLTLEGATFGRLTVTKFVSKKPRLIKGAQFGWLYYYACVCVCGGTATVERRSLTTGHTQSCGCLQAERLKRANTRHGETAGCKTTPEWRIWSGMIGRCHVTSHS